MWGSAVTIARIDGFDIKVDASWLLIATVIVWSLATGYFPQELPGAGTTTHLAMATVAMLGLFGSLILHELAHAVVARRFGLQVSSITLFLFGGVAELPSEPASGRSEFWIAIVGPVASLCIALAFWFSAQVTGLVGVSDAARLVLSYLAVLNLVLALFNLLPAFPMDGGRVFRAWLWLQTGDLLGATRRAAAVSAGFAYGFMALGLYAAFMGVVAAGLWPILIGLFLLATSRASLERLETEAVLDGRTVADLMSPNALTTFPDQSLSELVNRVFLAHAVTFAPVLENGTLLGYVDFQIVRRIDREHWTTTIVDDVIESAGEANTVSPDMACLELIEKITESGRRKFMVADRGVLLGVITLSDLLDFIRVSRQVG